jgi:hypothetical protein
MYSNTAMDVKTANGDQMGDTRLATRIALAAASAVVAVNVWTGAPLLAVWIGAQVQGDGAKSMGTVFVVIAALAVLEFALGWCLTWLGATYDSVTGREVDARRTSPWLRSLRGENEEDTRSKYGISAVERIVTLSVAAGVVAFEVWYFFFAGSPLG